MANCRLEKLGTIFSRVTALIRTGAMKRQDKPLWYDVYHVFPPRDEPSYANVKRTAAITDIFYPEDSIRAKFHQKMNRKLPPEDLAQNTTADITYRAITVTYDLLRKNASLTEDEAVDKAIDMLKAEGMLGTKRSFISGEPRKEISAEKKPDINTINAVQDVKTIVDKKIDISSLFKGKS